MAKKKRVQKAKKIDFNNDPFNHLKGFAVSTPTNKGAIVDEVKKTEAEDYVSFADEMNMLGVAPINATVEESAAAAETTYEHEVKQGQDDKDLFLAALDNFTVKFDEHLPEESAAAPVAEPRRLKQLKNGGITPDASLDLHGCLRIEVAKKMEHFLASSKRNDWRTVLVITGKGLHSKDGHAVLRDEVEKYLVLHGKLQVAEWARAPKQYGGSGALVLFLRKDKRAKDS